MATAVTFSATEHLYFSDGQVVPSVTQILSLAGIDQFPQIPFALRNRYLAGERGKAVHAACHYLDDGELEVDSVDPRIAGYVWAYQKFREKYEPRWTHLEQPMIYQGDLLFAGTPDRVGTLEVDGESMRFVLDLKTAKALPKYVAIQTAGYYLLVGGDPLRAVLHLKANGEYNLIPHRSDEDVEVFRAALRVAHWRLRNGANVNGDGNAED